MIDLSKVGHKRQRDHVLQWLIKNIWGNHERHKGALQEEYSYS